MLTMLPPPRSIIGPTACLQPKNTLRALMSNTRCQSSFVVASNSAWRSPTPALLTKKSRPPQSAAVWMASTNVDSSRTSPSCARTSPGPIAACPSCSRASRSRSTAITTAPRSVRCRTIARPMPRPAPVTTPTLAERSPVEPAVLICQTLCPWATVRQIHIRSNGAIHSANPGTGDSRGRDGRGRSLAQATWRSPFRRSLANELGSSRSRRREWSTPRRSRRRP